MEATDVYGLVPEERIDGVRRALARHGLTPPRVEVVPAAPGRYQLHDETLHHDAASARRGAVTGMVLGAVFGLAVALVLPQVTDTATTVGTVGALAGLAGLVGGMVGLLRAEHLDGGDPVDYREVGSDDHVVLVAVHDEHWRNRAHRILERQGAVFLQEPTPV